MTGQLQKNGENFSSKNLSPINISLRVCIQMEELLLNTSFNGLEFFEYVLMDGAFEAPSLHTVVVMHSSKADR